MMQHEMMFQLSVNEIDKIISFLQEPYAHELITRLEQLKNETIFYNKIHNQKIMDIMNEEKQIRENGFGTSPVSSAYFEITEAKE